MQISLSHNWRSYCKIPSADNAIIWNQKLLFKAPCKIVIQVKIFRFEVTLVILFWRREHSNNDPNSKPSIFKRQSGAREIGSWATNECNLMLRLLQTSSGEFFEKITPHSSNKPTYSFIKIPNCFGSFSRNKFKILTFSSMKGLKTFMYDLRVKIIVNLPMNHFVKAANKKNCYRNKKYGNDGF